MDLLPLSLSQRIPVEVISLIIHESDSYTTLTAWCLVSKGSLSIAGPLLMREVVLHRPKVIAPFLRDRFKSVYSTRPSSSSSSPPSCPLLQHLSTDHTRFLDLLVKPTMTFKMVAGQPLKRPRLTLSMVVRSSIGEDDLYVLSSWAPTVLRLLQPGRFSEVDQNGSLVVAFTPSVTSDYLAYLNSCDDIDSLNHVRDHVLMRGVQSIEEGAGGLLLLLEDVGGGAPFSNPMLDEIRGGLLGSEYRALKKELELLRGGELLEQEEVGGRMSRLHLRAARRARIRPLIDGILALMTNLSVPAGWEG